MGTLRWIEVMMFLMEGGGLIKIKNQGQGWVWGWENVIPEEIIVLYRCVIWCVCHTGSIHIIENSSTGHHYYHVYDTRHH